MSTLLSARSPGQTFAFPNDASEPVGSYVTDDDVDAMWAEEQARRDEEVEAFFNVPMSDDAPAADGDDHRTPPRPSAAMFPEMTTWPDDQLIVAITLADIRDPGLNLHAVGNLPDRHAQFMDEATDELMRRLVDHWVSNAASKAVAA